MVRGANGRLKRWTARPALVIVGTVMKYNASATDRYEALGERLTGDEVTALTNHLNEALALLTGGTFTSFASVKVEWPAAGERVGVQRSGTIVVGRYTGVQDQEQTIGYGSWAEQPDGTVVGGSMWLDRDFDRDDAAAAVGADSRARTCARLQPRDRPDLDHEPLARTLADGLRPRCRADRVSAARREHVARHRSGRRGRRVRRR